MVEHLPSIYDELGSVSRIKKEKETEYRVDNVY
jgi:hypothetical protein